jgi:hypothetical protein
VKGNPKTFDVVGFHRNAMLFAGTWATWRLFAKRLLAQTAPPEPTTPTLMYPHDGAR